MNLQGIRSFSRRIILISNGSRSLKGKNRNNDRQQEIINTTLNSQRRNSDSLMNISDLIYFTFSLD